MRMGIGTTPLGATGLAVVVALAATAPCNAEPAQKKTDEISETLKSGAQQIGDGAQRIGEGIKDGAIYVWEALKAGASATSAKLSGNDTASSKRGTAASEQPAR
jgi:hypothetical protein